MERKCPHCERPDPRRIQAESDISGVSYYCCSGCAHVWSVDRRTEQVIGHVTPLRKRAAGS